MTLILSFASRFGVTQVVDRRVTEIRRGTHSVHDPQSNKTIVYAPRDAVVVMSYTGLSYIGDTPTDQWITENLAGEKIASGRYGGLVTYQSLKLKAPWPSLGEALKCLDHGIVDALKKEARNPKFQGLKIVIVGWQFYARRSRPFIKTITLKGTATSCTIDSMPRHIGTNGYLTVEPKEANYISNKEANELFDSIDGQNADGIEREMISRVRMVAARSPFVGPDCICVSLSPPSKKLGRVRYDSLAVLEAEFISPIPIPIVFAPSIVDELAVRPASILSGPGPFSHHLGKYLLHIHGTGRQPAHRLQPVMFQTDQPRRKRPT